MYQQCCYNKVNVKQGFKTFANWLNLPLTTIGIYSFVMHVTSTSNIDIY